MLALQQKSIRFASHKQETPFIYRFVSPNNGVNSEDRSSIILQFGSLPTVESLQYIQNVRNFDCISFRFIYLLPFRFQSSHINGLKTVPRTHK